jgi:hypothetical protein
MTNKEIQEKVLERLQSVLGITASEYYNKPHDKIFPVSKRAAYHVAIGQFDSKYVGELGLMKLEKFFKNLENDKENGKD